MGLSSRVEKTWAPNLLCGKSFILRGLDVSFKSNHLFVGDNLLCLYVKSYTMELKGKEHLDGVYCLQGR